MRPNPIPDRASSALSLGAGEGIRTPRPRPWQARSGVGELRAGGVFCYPHCYPNASVPSGKLPKLLTYWQEWQGSNLQPPVLEFASGRCARYRAISFSVAQSAILLGFGRFQNWPRNLAGFVASKIPDVGSKLGSKLGSTPSRDELTPTRPS